MKVSINICHCRLRYESDPNLYFDPKYHWDQMTVKEVTPDKPKHNTQAH